MHSLFFALIISNIDIIDIIIIIIIITIIIIIFFGEKWIEWYGGVAGIKKLYTLFEHSLSAVIKLKIFYIERTSFKKY